MSLDLSSLSAADIAGLRAMLNGTDPMGRSPMKPRQLHNLTLLPSATDPRPTFFWSAESPRDTGDLSRTTLYPRLMWHGQTGEEITVEEFKAIPKDKRAHFSRRPLSTEQMLSLIDVAVKLHTQAAVRRQELRWWVSIVVTALSALVGAMIGATWK